MFDKNWQHSYNMAVVNTGGSDSLFLQGPQVESPATTMILSAIHNGIQNELEYKW